MIVSTLLRAYAQRRQVANSLSYRELSGRELWMQWVYEASRAQRSECLVRSRFHRRGSASSSQHLRLAGI